MTITMYIVQYSSGYGRLQHERTFSTLNLVAEFVLYAQERHPDQGDFVVLEETRTQRPINVSFKRAQSYTVIP